MTEAGFEVPEGWAEVDDAYFERRSAEHAATPHTVHATQNVVEALEVPEPDPLTFELKCLWQDLDEARRTAIRPGAWSMRCEHIVYRIAQLTMHIGKPLPWEQVQITLLEDGTYQAVHKALGIKVEVDMDRVAEVRRSIEGRRARGGSAVTIITDGAP